MTFWNKLVEILALDGKCATPIVPVVVEVREMAGGAALFRGSLIDAYTRKEFCERRLDRAVRQAFWYQSNGHPAHMRKMMDVCLKTGAVPDLWHRWVISYWHRPPEHGAYR